MWGIPFHVIVPISVDAIKPDNTTDETSGYVFRLPLDLSQQKFTPLGSCVYENGARLPIPVKTRTEVDRYGEGRFCIKKRAVSFSTEDASDPRSNGREYSAKIPLTLSNSYWIWALIVLTAGILGLTCISEGRRLSHYFLYHILRSQHVARADVLVSKVLPFLWIALLVSKLWLIADNELIAINSDAYGYIKLADDPTYNPIWSPGPGLLLGGLWYQTGIPYRIGIELLWFGACMVTGRALRLSTGSALLGILIPALLLFYPFTFEHFSTYFSEPFTVAFVLAGISWILQSLTSCVCGWKTPSLWLAGLALGAWSISRIENHLIILLWASFALSYGWKFKTSRGIRNLTRAALPTLVTLTVLLVMQLGLKAYNYANHGVWMQCELAAPGYTMLMKRLWVIDSEDSLRLAPVTRKALEMACDVSPTLQKYQNKLLNPDIEQTRLGEQEVGVKGEPGGYIFWLILANIRADTPQKTDAIRRLAARELDQAFADGRLKKRLAIYPLHASWKQWIPFMPETLSYAITSLLKQNNNFYTSDYHANQWFPNNFINDVQELFNRAGMRRESLLGRYPWSLQGVIEGTKKQTYTFAIEVRGVALQSSLVTESYQGAPRLVDCLPTNSDSVEFTVKGTIPEKLERQTFLVIYSNGKSYAKVPITDIKEESSYNLSQYSVEDKVISSDVVLNVKKVTKHSMEEYTIPRSHTRLTVTLWYSVIQLCSLVVVFLFGFMSTINRDQLKALVLFALIGVFGLVLPRLLYYSTIISNFGWFTERYYLAAIAPFFLTAAVATFLLGQFLQLICIQYLQDKKF